MHHNQWRELFLPTTVSLKTWLIFGFVETWHSKVPASVALVNFNLRVFCPRLKQHLTFYHAFSFSAATGKIINYKIYCASKIIKLLKPAAFYMLKTVKVFKQIQLEKQFLCLLLMQKWESIYLNWLYKRGFVLLFSYLYSNVRKPFNCRCKVVKPGLSIYSQCD